MAGEKVCWCNGRRMAWTVREVREGQGEIFYDATMTAQENWHSRASAREALASLWPDGSESMKMRVMRELGRKKMRVRSDAEQGRTSMHILAKG